VWAMPQRIQQADAIGLPMLFKRPMSGIFRLD
jgi:hypothetical protein